MDRNKALLGVLAVVTVILVIYPKPQRPSVQYFQPPLQIQEAATPATALKQAPILPSKALKLDAKPIASSRKIPTVLPDKIGRRAVASTKHSGRLSSRKPASVTAKALRYGKGQRSVARAR